MASSKQRAAARKNVKKAARAAKRANTRTTLPKREISDRQGGKHMIATETADREREQRARLAAAIEDRKAEIEHRWLDTVRAAVEREDLRLTELRDAMPDYLASLIRALREE